METGNGLPERFQFQPVETPGNKTEIPRTRFRVNVRQERHVLQRHSTAPCWQSEEEDDEGEDGGHFSLRWDQVWNGLGSAVEAERLDCPSLTTAVVRPCLLCQMCESKRLWARKFPNFLPITGPGISPGSFLPVPVERVEQEAAELCSKHAYSWTLWGLSGFQSGSDGSDQKGNHRTRKEN